MEKRELENIIAKLEETDLKKDASIGFYFNEEQEEYEAHIRANTQGLLLFASELLKASRDAEEIKKDPKRSIYILDFEDDCISADSDFSIDFIEPTTQKNPVLKKEIHEETWQDQFFRIGCSGILILALISAIVGFINIIQFIIA